MINLNISKILKHSKILLISIATIFISSCALKQESININPQIKAANYNMGNHQKVNIIVNYYRKNNNIGGRPSQIGQVSAIKINNSLKQNIKNAVAKTLKSYNFIPTEKNTNAKLTLNIININYIQSSKYLVKGDIQITCNIQAIAVNNQMKYSRIYKTTFTKKIILTPTDKEDNENINKVVSVNLEKILSDQNILVVLSNNN